MAQILTMGIIGSQIETKRIFSLAKFFTMGIIGSQIETERIFSLAQILINLKKCRFQTNYLKLLFVNKNWPNDPIRGCKSPSDLLEFFERDMDFKKEFKEFEREFERDEVVKV